MKFKEPQSYGTFETSPLYQRAASVFDRVRVMKAGYNKAP